MPRPIFQFPNRPAIIAGLARGTALALGDEAGRGARNLSNVALVAWAYEEITDGENWFRRLLGLGGLTYAVRALITGW